MIAAIKEENKIFIGYTDKKEESVALGDYLCRENIPCYTDGDLIVFFAISNASSDYLTCHSEIFSGELSVDTIRSSVLPQIKKAAEKLHGVTNGRWQNAAVICKNGRLFSIASDFYVKEENDYVCIGYSPEYARSVLDTERGLPPKERIAKAFEFHKNSTGEGGCPVIYIDSEEKRLKVLSGGGDDEYIIGL